MRSSCVHLVAAGVVLYFLGWLLDRVLVVFPEWVAGLVG